MDFLGKLALTEKSMGCRQNEQKEKQGEKIAIGWTKAQHVQNMLEFSINS